MVDQMVVDAPRVDTDRDAGATSAPTAMGKVLIDMTASLKPSPASRR